MVTICTIIKYLTFPGAILKASLEQFVCKMFNITVEDNRPLQHGEVAGHVEHELATKAGSAFFICYLPTFIMQLFALLIGAMPTMSLLYFQRLAMPSGIVDIVAYWLACSLFLNSFPLWEDVLNAIDKIYKSKSNIFAKIIFLPGTLFLAIGSWLESHALTLVTLAISIVALLFI